MWVRHALELEMALDTEDFKNAQIFHMVISEMLDSLMIFLQHLILCILEIIGD